MRSRLLTFVLALSALAVVAAPAGAQSSRPTIGISENSPNMFANPLFQQLGARHARVVVSYDFLSRGDDELARVDTYLRQAQATNTQVLVAFEHSRGDASRCNQRRFRNQRQCRLPSTQAYTRAVQAFFQRFGGLVRAFSPWNEVNHFTQPTARNARRAAQFSNIARRFCRGTCQLVAMDLLDQARSVVSRNPDYRDTVRYIRTLRRSLRVPRSICGLHNYSDTNRFRDNGTRTLIRAMGCRQIWLTETGGLYRFGRSFPASQSRQLRATRYLFNTLVRRNRRVRRVYIYTFFGNVTPRFDAGLVVNTRARSAYREVQRRLRR